MFPHTVPLYDGSLLVRRAFAGRICFPLSLPQINGTCAWQYENYAPRTPYLNDASTSALVGLTPARTIKVT